MKANDNFLFILLAFLGLSVSSCVTNNSTRDDNVVKKEERPIGHFNGIDLAFSADVKISQGSPQKVVIEGTVSDLKNVITEIDGSNLIVRKKPGRWQIGKVIVFITMEQLNTVSVGGSGTIMNETPLKTSTIHLDVSGNGLIRISDISAENVISAVSGSGSITLNGNELVDRQKMDISGSGTISVQKLRTTEADINLSGSGACNVFVTDTLRVHLSGSGDVNYTGKPIVELNRSGSGKVKNMPQ